MAEQPSAVHKAARELGRPLVMPRTLKIPAVESLFASHRADVAVVVAYGLILPKVILRAPRYGCLNLHASALPRWRGAAPIERAMMAGDKDTAVMVMRMEEGLDTGPVCLTEATMIAVDETTGDLRKRLSYSGADLMVRALRQLADGTLVCAPQSETGSTYAGKVGKSETRIDWKRPASDLQNQVRGLSPSPGAWCEFSRKGGKERMKILRARRAEGAGPAGTILCLDPLVVACGMDALELTEVQLAGKKPASAAEFLRGARLAQGAMLA
jgi:methionyl-tRNA formyltransferase